MHPWRHQPWMLARALVWLVLLLPVLATPATALATMDGGAPPRKRARRSSGAGLVDIEDIALPSNTVASLQEELLGWYRAHRRKLPWRGDAPPYTATADAATASRAAAQPAPVKQQAKISAYFQQPPAAAKAPPADPEEELRAHPFPRSAYATWVSEVMLQQTRVDTVVDYFLKWMARFPTVHALAEAPLEEVNSCWAGLGYYRRARMLHQGAQFVRDELAGELPETAAELEKISGIGPYTAGAIASIAFGQPAPVVDGNVIRVFARLHRLQGEPAKLTAPCWSLAARLLHPTAPGDFNQALMELGATVCTPKNPECAACPVRRHCRAAAAVASGELESVTSIPAKATKKPLVERFFAVAVLVNDADGDGTRRWLMTQRADTGLLAGQWEFPAVEIDEPPTDADVDETKQQLTQALAVESTDPAFVALLRDLALAGTVVHVFSHQRHTMQVFCGRVRQRASSPPSTGTWMTQNDMARVGLTTGAGKVLKAAERSAGLQRRETRVKS